MIRGFHENLNGPGGSIYMSEHLDKIVNALSLDSERLNSKNPIPYWPFHICSSETSIVLVTGS
jgi:hypothetical protein